MKGAARLLLVAVALAGILAVPASAAAEGDAIERALLQRLFAPCCYRETLDVHVSPLAVELRLQIHERLARRESADRILADLVSRFGDAVLTRPPRSATALGLFAGSALAVACLIGLALRRSRRDPQPPDAERDVPSPRTPELEDRLDDALHALD